MRILYDIYIYIHTVLLLYTTNNRPFGMLFGVDENICNPRASWTGHMAMEDDVLELDI